MVVEANGKGITPSQHRRPNLLWIADRLRRVWLLSDHLKLHAQFPGSCLSDEFPISRVITRQRADVDIQSQDLQDCTMCEIAVVRRERLKSKLMRWRRPPEC